ncbi:invasion associated locus B [Ahrensia sp. R2A130]|nr:invasion associated locus B [Ahrensia sp. R2A130]
MPRSCCTVRRLRFPMIRRFYMSFFPIRSFSLALFALLMVTGIHSAASAQSTSEEGTKFGAWTIICDTPPGASSEQCALMQNVVADDRPEVGLSVVVLKTADNKARILRVLAPLGVILPNGLGLNIDGKDLGRANFVRCMSDGCYAEVILQDELLGQMQIGATATFIIFATPEEGIGIPVDLTGFKDGFVKLP